VNPHPIAPAAPDIDLASESPGRPQSATLRLRHAGQLLDFWFWYDGMLWLGECSTKHFKRWWWAWAMFIAALWGFSHFYWIGINVTESLPQRLFLVQKTEFSLARNDFVSFRWDGGPPYPKGITFTKIVKGLPGDVVTVRGRDFYINGQFIATAKTNSKKGEPLDLGPTGVIPPGKYFVWTPHPDSLDSRYARAGWIGQELLQGKSIPLF
jgi:conjugal transfer pilin signal peptidase TrbI